jgi:hypothetical protein
MKLFNVNIAQVNPQPQDQDDRVGVANYVPTLN